MDLKELKKPFPISSLKWRIGNKNKDKTKANMLVYIDSRDVMDRLDKVCGVDGWSDSYQEYNKIVTDTDWKTKVKSDKHFNKTNCTISINTDNGWVSKTDGAGDTNVEAEKGSNSDAFKRAGVKWGIGRYLYDASKFNTWVNCKDISDFKIYENNKTQLDKVATEISVLCELSTIDNIADLEEYYKTNSEYYNSIINFNAMVNDRKKEIPREGGK